MWRHSDSLVARQCARVDFTLAHLQPKYHKSASVLLGQNLFNQNWVSTVAVFGIFNKIMELGGALTPGLLTMN